MPKTLICSVGTSAAKGLDVRPAGLKAWVADHGGPTKAAVEMYARFADIKPEGEALTRVLSAEIHSLVRLDVARDDNVILLASETEDGYACALAVELYLHHHFDGIHVETVRVEGLQVVDADRFRRIGVVNYVKRCLQTVNAYGAPQVVLNPTGGYKALVPYTVLIGMLKQVPCKYIFEQSTSLLTLPALPIAIDRAPFEQYRLLFEQIERDSSVPRQDWYATVARDDQPLLVPLFEEEGDQVTLSGVGLLFWDEIRTRTHLVPFLSQKAWRDCLDNLCQVNDCDPFRFLARVASDPAALERAVHITLENGLRWLKPGNTRDRYLVSIEGWKLLVWRTARKDQDGDNYASTVTVDPERDRHRYGPFTRMEFDQPLR
jgi:putative CRISPR-associated protein (TIGR02619 family)